jgi:hypothetical protein
MSEAMDFLEALTMHMREEERVIMCMFPGDPNDAQSHDWKPRPWSKGKRIPLAPNENAYVTVAAFTRSNDGSFRRRQDYFGSGLALMIDDIGTSPSSKLEPRYVECLKPNAIVETSEGNFQWWYFLDKPELDFGRFDALIRGFIDCRLLGKDPGMGGVTRVGRLPGFVNGKAKHNGWICKLTHLDDKRTSFAQLVDSFSITLWGRTQQFTRITGEGMIARIKEFTPVHAFLETAGMMKRLEFDLSGWAEMRCPWVDEHTGGVDNGAALREPAEQNGFYGAFRCHHGSCNDRGWRELTEWVAQAAAQESEDRNIAYANALYGKLKCYRTPGATDSMKKFWDDQLAKFEGVDE